MGEQGGGRLPRAIARGEHSERCRLVQGAERGLLDYEVVDRLFAAHRHGRGDWSKHLWNLYCVSRWYDRWVARTHPYSP